MSSYPTKQAIDPLLVALRPRPLTFACAVALFGLALGCNASAQEAQPSSTTSQETTVKATKVDSGKQKAAKKPAADNAPKINNLDAVIVTGIQASIESSIRAKQNSDNIIEAISAEDIGKLPDASIAESLARLPGLATQRMNGRASVISIRGLSPDFTGTTLNGREQATTGENRGVQYDQYPSELISGAVVYKTPDAGLIGQGLSGTVDLHTIKPLDLPGRVITANLRGEYNTNGDLDPGSSVGTLGHRTSISYIDQFFDHTLGVAVGFAQLDSPIQEKQYNYWWWDVNNGAAGADTNWGADTTPGLPNDVVSQQGMQVSAQSQRQLRNGLMAVLEWAPGEHYHSTLDMYYSTFNDRKYTNGAQWSTSSWDNLTYSNVGITPSKPYPIVTSGTIDGVLPILQNQYTRDHDKLFSIGWNNEYDFGNGWQAMADLSYSSVNKDLRDASTFMGLPAGSFATVNFNTPVNFGFPNFSTNVNLTDPNVMVFTDPLAWGYNGREEFDHQKDSIKALRLEVSHPAGWIFGDFTLGMDYSERVKTKKANVLFAWLNGNGSTATTYNPAFSAPVNPALLGSPTSLGFGGMPGALYYDVLGALASQYYLTENNDGGDLARNYTVKEKVPVGYLRFNIDTALAGIPLRGNVGAQVVHTNQSSQALQTNGDVLVGQISDGTSYTKFLPSLNLVAQLTDRQYLRFGLAKTMARGRIDDEKVSTSASVARVVQGPGAGQVLWSGSGGNPHLKPYVAVGADLSYEFYFGKSSYLAAAVFNKNLLNYIYTQTVLNHDFSHFTNDNPTLTPTSSYGPYSMPLNGTGGRMQGLELSGSLEGGLLADVLDGFGAQANFSLTNSSIPQNTIQSIPGAPSTLPGLSRKVANLEVFYEKYGWSVRLAERYRSSFTGEAVALFDQLGYTKVLANHATDFQLGYAFDAGRWKGLSLLLQVSNLTDTSDSTVQITELPNGVQMDRPQEYDTWGRTVMFGITYKL